MWEKSRDKSPPALKVLKYDLKERPSESPFFYSDVDEINKKYYNTNLKHLTQGYRKPSDEILMGNDYVLTRFDARRSSVENFKVSLDSEGKVG